MTDLYTDQPGSKKKYLIPLVVLLLCAVSLTGAGYAYNSTVTTNGNAVYTDAENLVLTGDSVSITVQFGVDFKSSTTNGTTTWSVDDAHSTLTDSFKIQLKSTVAGTRTVTLAASGLTDLQAPVADPTTPGITYVVKFYSDAACNTEITTVDLTANADATTIYMKLTVTVQEGAQYTPVVGDHVKTFTITANTDDTDTKDVTEPSGAHPTKNSS